MSAVHAGDRVGPYEIRELIGQGGMGKVYRAHDPQLGRELALKLLAKREGEDPAAVDRFVREARAASALNHPNVVTIYEIGDDANGRYIAMEYVAGVTLRALIERGRDGDSLPRVGAQIARALAMAHEAGIVHRDIKPENIMVRDDGLVKVLDFGIARLVTNTDGTALEAAPTQVGRAVGTLRYMSPEQACAEPVTTASDVFSLGIILHELATGQHPFAAHELPTSDVAVVSRILTATASPASATNPTLSADLDRLVLRMLEKDARRRPAAREVESLLAELSAATRSGAAPSALSVHARHTVGRKRESEVLRQALAEADGGRGNIVSVSGEPGMGKTTLVEEFLSDVTVSTRQRLVAHGRCSERLAGTEAYLPILEALDSLTRGSAAGTTVALMKRLAPTWYLQIAPAGDGDSSEARALTSIQASSQERMKRELTTFLTELSATTTVVLFLDDLHWSDVSTVDVLAYIGARLGGIRLMVLVTVRPAELLLNKHPFASLKLDLQARGICREIALEFLHPNDVEDYLAVEFPDHEFPPDFAALVHAKTEGSPLFMADVLRYLLTRGIVAKESGRWILAKSLPAIEHDLPESVRGMIQQKIEQITEEDRKLLMAASVHGYEFDSAVVADLTGIDAADVEERLETLEHVYGFVRRSYERDLPDGTLSVRYRFVHVLYQNALYASLTPSRRIATSARAAGSLTRHYGEQSGDIAANLAILYEAARDTPHAVEQLIVAAENAAKLFANQEVLALSQRGLALVTAIADRRERAEREMLLQALWMNALGATQGIGSAEVGQAAARV
ncbi:MAG: protein kinase, partial [Gemmatimonas sp.]